jgi:hypothetical protein
MHTWAFVLALLPVTVHAQRLQNAGFEMVPDTGSVQPKFWWVSDGLHVQPSTERPAEGLRALHVRGEASPNAPGHIVQNDTSRYMGLHKLRIAAKVKVNSGEAGVELFAYSTTAEGGTLNYQVVRPQGNSPHSGWEELVLTFWVNDQVRSLRIGLQLKSTVDLLVDDFSVEELPRKDILVVPELQRYADEVLALVAEHSLYRSTLDTAALRDQLSQLLADGRSKDDFHQVANFFLKSVDKHSFYWSKAEVDAWRGADAEDQEAPVAELAFDFTITTGHLIGDDVAYLNMPPFNSGNAAWDTYFADTLQGLIRALDRPGLKGWVLDLRENQGGNCWPMLAGIGPVLGTGVCGYFGADEDQSDWSIAEGRSLMDDAVQCAISRAPYTLLAPVPRVAVITGPSTASSGEVVAVAFRGRPGARSFGSPTAGYSTTNTSFDLSDGAMLFLATSVYVDRAMNAYGGELPPDDAVPASTEGDAPLERAVQWLRGQ